MKNTFQQLKLVCTAALCSMFTLSSSQLFAHPGHDHHVPQTGILHWLLAPIHAIPILLVIGLLITIVAWKLRLSSRFDAK
jgi:hydrogenase/urease accessory protein HupE